MINDPKHQKSQRVADWILAALAISVIAAEIYWAYTLWYNNRSPWTLDSVILFAYCVSIFSAVGVAIGAVGSLAGRVWRQANTIGMRPAWAAGAWVLFFLLVRLLTRGVYFSEWGIESKYAAFTIRLVQFVVATLLAAASAWLLRILITTLPTWGRHLVMTAVIVALPLSVSLFVIEPTADVVLPNHRSPLPPRTLALLAFDGLTWNVLGPLIEEGQLPHFARLTAGGSYGELRTIEIGSTPLIWNSISTGHEHRIHGVGGHVSVRFVGMDSRFFFPHRTGFNHIFAPLLDQLDLLDRHQARSLDRRVPAFWNIADHYDRSTVLINWHSTAPVERVSGINVAAGLHSALQARSNRQIESTEDTKAAVGFYSLYVYPSDFIHDLVQLEPGLSSRLEYYSDIAEAALDRIPRPEIFALYTELPDWYQHRFWNYHEPDKYFGTNQDDLAANENKIREVYGSLDKYLGRLLSILPDDSIVIVLSDHGAEAVFNEWGTEGGHGNGPPGVLIMYGPGMAAGRRILRPSIFDILPTLSYLKGFPIARDWRGEVLWEVFDPGSLTSARSGFIDSYGTHEPAVVTEREVSVEAQEKELERLKSLGYIR